MKISVNLKHLCTKTENQSAARKTIAVFVRILLMCTFQ